MKDDNAAAKRSSVSKGSASFEVDTSNPLNNSANSLYDLSPRSPRHSTAKPRRLLGCSVVVKEIQDDGGERAFPVLLVRYTLQYTR